MKWIVGFVFLLLAACVNLGGTTPQTPKERMVALEYGYQGALNTILKLSQSGILSGAAKDRAAVLVGQAGTALRSARLAFDSGAPDTLTAINLANSALLQLINFLETKKGQQSWDPMLYSHSKFLALLSQQLEKQPQSPCKSMPLYQKPVQRDGTLVMLSLHQFAQQPMP